MIPPDKACTYCDRCPRYTKEDTDPWASVLLSWGIGQCCATTWIREQFKSAGVDATAVGLFNLTGSFRDYARAVFDAGPSSELGKWFIAEYMKENK